MPTQPISDYEKERLERIAKNESLLRSLALDAATVGLAARTPAGGQLRAATGAGVGALKKSTAARKKRPGPRLSNGNEGTVPLRVSKRLRGLPPDGADERNNGNQTAEDVADLPTSSSTVSINPKMRLQGWKGNVLEDDYKSMEYGDEMVPTNDSDVEKMRQKMSEMKLWKDIDPNRIAITPERIYSIAFHPTKSKPLIFAGDKLGNFGLLDASQSLDCESDDENDDVGANTVAPEITRDRLHSRSISAFQVCPSDPNVLYSASYDGTIRSLDLVKGVSTEIFAPHSGTSLSKAWDSIGFSGLQIPESNGSLLHFTTLGGHFGIHDVRVPFRAGSDSGGTGPGMLVQLFEKKIGGFSLHPRRPYLVATASLDRTFRLWDLRKMVAPSANDDGEDDEEGGGCSLDSVRDPAVKREPKGEAENDSSDSEEGIEMGGENHNTRPHPTSIAAPGPEPKVEEADTDDGRGSNDGEDDDDDGDNPEPYRVPALLGTHPSRLSVSHAAFSSSGHVVTTSYDDTVKVYDFSQTCAGADWKPGQRLTESQLEPVTVIRHNNQTGRWVSILKPHWQANPVDGLGPRFCVGNMKRWVDVFSVRGDLIGQLGGSERVNLSAVPAVTAFHPEQDWLVGGTARGKLCLWIRGG